jgi:DNA-binding transcriptional ArsR family regulator
MVILSHIMTEAMTDRMVELIAKRFRMLGEPFRIRILQQLQTGEKTVNELVANLDGNQPNVSKHLALLHDSGLVGRRREGTSVVYAISDPMVFRLCDLVCRSETEKSKREFEELNGQTSAKRRR